jgi:hypothetical protein
MSERLVDFQRPSSSREVSAFRWKDFLNRSRIAPRRPKKRTSSVTTKTRTPRERRTKEAERPVHAQQRADRIPLAPNDLARELLPPADFQGASRAHRTRQKCRALPAIKPYLQTNCFQGDGPLKRKENSARGSRRRIRVHLRCREQPASR